jgi:hypothetical protein
MTQSDGGWTITSKSTRVRFLVMSRNMSCYVNRRCNCLVYSRLLVKQLQIGQMVPVLVANEYL